MNDDVRDEEETEEELGGASGTDLEEGNLEKDLDTDSFDDEDEL
ncbi:MAG: hypothetical protein G01um101472_436 [Parcubacteria group bacterium Gr01-1014_72]|nr:MAG: hypothetical protein G01um101472_436 [Parcubacteria group bacterium Gr01-1014_72]